MDPIHSSLSEAEKKSCVILSTLFLDAELTSSQIDHMARDLNSHGLPVDQLDDIIRLDLFPILHTNLLHPTGAWDSFNEADLINRIAERRSQPRSIIQKLYNSLAWAALGSSMTSPWVQVKERMRQQQKRTAAPDVPSMVRVFSSSISDGLPRMKSSNLPM